MQKAGCFLCMARQYFLRVKMALGSKRLDTPALRRNKKETCRGEFRVSFTKKITSNRWWGDKRKVPNFSLLDGYRKLKLICIAAGNNKKIVRH